MSESKLNELLERHREALQAVSGVLAVGIGAPRGGNGGERELHVYVDPGADRELIRREVRAEIPGVPFETIGMEMPEAETGSMGDG